MRILITNDDGCEAPGLLALFRALSPLGEIDVVAPQSERSMCSHSVQLRQAMRVELRAHAEMGQVWAVEGWPADCVRVALAGLLGHRPDWVVSGINAGANLGADVHYSGTVAGAREGALHGIPAVAISHFFRKSGDIDWRRATRLASRMFSLIRVQPHRPKSFWNVNLPWPDGTDADAVPHAFAPLCPEAIPLVYRHHGDAAQGDFSIQYSGLYEARPRTPGSDVDALFSGRIAISHLSLNAACSEGA